MSEQHQHSYWRRTSRLTLLSRPICEDPFGVHALTGSYAPSQVVHHIHHVADRPDLVTDPSNLLALCPDCHAALHGATDAVSGLLKAGVSAKRIAATIARYSRPGSPSNDGSDRSPALTELTPKGVGGCF